jgi:hypothetical protein
MTTCEVCHSKPTRDKAYVCTTCADVYAAALRDLDVWLEDELDNSLHGTQGIEYKHGRLSGGGDGGLRVNWHVGDLQHKLLVALISTCAHCERVGTRHVSSSDETPAGAMAEMARWLRWRVDGLTLDPEAPSLMGRIASLTARARLVVDRPADHEYLGQCEHCKRGRVYAIAGESAATCEACRKAYDADTRRRRLVAELDDRLVTAAECARLSTYLGLRDDRERVRKRVNTWHRRGRIEAHDSVLGDEAEVMFRFGDVWRLLVAEDAKTQQKPA